MTVKIPQLSKVGKTHSSPLQSPNSRKYAAVRTREYLLEKEIEAMRDALKKAGGRHAHRDLTFGDAKRLLSSIAPSMPST